MSIRKSILDQKIDSLSRVFGNAEALTIDFQKFRKLLAECSVVDGMDINQIVQDAKDIIEGGESFSNFITNPNRVICFSTAIAGLAQFTQEEIKKVQLDLKTYYKGLLPKMNDFIRGLSVEYGPERLSQEFMSQLDGRMADLMDIGAGFVGSQLAKVSSSIDEQALKAAARLGKVFGFLMSVSPELRYIVLSMFIKNMQDQTLNRIQQILNLKKAINGLIYDIDKINNNVNKSGIDLSISFQAYKNALNILENTIPLSLQQEYSVIQKNFYDTFLTTNILSNLESAKTLLYAQRNKFLENIFKTSVVEFESNVKYLYLLSNDYSNYRIFNTVYSSVAQSNENFLENLKELNAVLISHPYNTTNNYFISFFKKNGNNYDFVIDTPNIEFDLPDVILKIDKYFFKIIDRREERFQIDQTIVTKQILTLEIFKNYYLENEIQTIENTFNKRLEVFLDLPFSFESRPLSFNINDNTYFIEKIDTNILNTIVLKKEAETIIKNTWGEQTGFSFIWFFKYSNFNKIVSVNGGYPNIVEKEPLPLDSAFLELPQPYKDLYNQYLNLNEKKIEVGDVFKTGGVISNFLFGRDIVNGPIDKIGNFFSSYDEFMKTGGEVLKNLCLVKQSLYSFYTLFDNLENLDSKQNTIAFETNKEILLNLQRIITDTLQSMTSKGANGEYITIEEIKNSAIYSKLIPMLVLDYGNLTNLQGILKTLDGLGQSFNGNTALKDEFKRIDTLVSYIQSKRPHIDALKLEEELWNTLSISFIDSVELMVQGERIDNIKPMIDEVYIKIDTLLISLNELYNKLLTVDTSGATTIKARRNLESIFEELGVSHWANYLKNGELEKFVNNDFASWVGKYGPTITCLTKILPKTGGYDKLILSKVVNYLKYIDISEIITNFHLGDLELGHSVNLNIFSEVSSSTQNGLKNAIDRIAMVKSSITRLNKLKDTK